MAVPYQVSRPRGDDTTTGSAMTEVMKQDAVAGANLNTVSKCKSGSDCNFGGQPISCDETSFVIDVSGSMGMGKTPIHGPVIDLDIKMVDHTSIELQPNGKSKKRAIKGN